MGVDDIIDAEAAGGGDVVEVGAVVDDVDDVMAGEGLYRDRAQGQERLLHRLGVDVGAKDHLQARIGGLRVQQPWRPKPTQGFIDADDPGAGELAGWEVNADEHGVVGDVAYAHWGLAVVHGPSIASLNLWHGVTVSPVHRCPRGTPTEDAAMIIAVDVDYRDAGAVAAAVGVNDVGDATMALERTVAVANVAPYVPGAFYVRELPCLLALWHTLPVDDIDTVIVDGHAWLGDGQMGLGAHLHQALQGLSAKGVRVIGVAKTPWHDRQASVEVRRHGAKALWVSAVGVSDDGAAEVVRRLHGPHRLPTLLKRVDRLCRDAPL